MRKLDDRTEWSGVLGQVMMFQTLNANDRQIIWEKGDVLFCDETEMVIQDGELSQSFFVVLDGTVKVHVMEEGTDGCLPAYPFRSDEFHPPEPDGWEPGPAGDHLSAYEKTTRGQP